MPDYIEREAVINDIGELFTICHETLPNECGHHFIVENELKTHLNFVKNLPAADVREVVCCRECKYCPTGTDNGEEQGFGLEFPYAETYKCPFQCDDRWYSRKPRPDFFCANGERRAEMKGEADGT